MGNKLEQLLNSLIEKGWKPFGSNYGRYEHGCLILEFTTKDGVYSYGQYPTTLREFCAKESGLWQFVCENHLYIFRMGENKNFIQDHFRNKNNECCYQYLWDESFYEYYLLESALKDESELESFILDNIKVGNEQL